MNHLLAEMERNPMLHMDFDAIFSIWELARDFSEDEVRESLSYLDNMENMQLKMTLQMMLMNRWGKINGPAAMEFAMKAENRQTRMMQFMGTMMSWTKEDPDAAFSWYDKNKDKMGGGMYAGAYEGMIYQALARHDLNRALEAVQRLENTQKKQMALSGIAQGIANDPEKFSSFIKFLEKEEPGTKKAVMGGIIGQLAMTSPETAKKYIDQIADPQEKAEMINGLIQGMSFSDPETAIKWAIENSEDEKAQAQALAQALPNWVIQNPKAAREWYDQQPAHLKSDNLIRQSAVQLASSEQYKEAFAWIERGEDANTMTEAKKDTYRLWLQKSPDQAKAWAEGEGKETMRGIDLDALQKEMQSTPSSPYPKVDSEDLINPE